MTISRDRLWLCLLLLLVLPAQAPASSQDPTTLVIGKVSHNPKKHYRYLKPIAEYAAERMADLGVKRVKVLMARGNARMVQYLRQGRVDWVTETVMSASVFVQEASAEILLRKFKKGVPEYHTVFFTRKDSGIERLGDLVGRTLALEDRGSTSAYFMPLRILLEQGHELELLDSPRQRPIPRKIGFLLAREEINISTLVHKRLADAGAFNNLDWNKEDHLPHIFQRDMRVIHRSKDVPRAVELVRRDLDPRIRDRLKALLLRAHQDLEAESALRAYQRTTRFEEFSAAQIKSIKALYRTVLDVQRQIR